MSSLLFSSVLPLTEKPLYIKGFRTFGKIDPCVIITQKQHKSQRKADFYMVDPVPR